jgi:hypothetical protein
MLRKAKINREIFRGFLMIENSKIPKKKELKKVLKNRIALIGSLGNIKLMFFQ